ncbi:MAG: hypothetical protein C5B50_00435 [Verrucomicrobia bacterium]|nr:MAG: hypothetical protein C5B50_00435 [Verrucomicrobiota bacterium]
MARAEAFHFLAITHPLLRWLEFPRKRDGLSFVAKLVESCVGEIKNKNLFLTAPASVPLVPEGHLRIAQRFSVGLRNIRPLKSRRDG